MISSTEDIYYHINIATSGGFPSQRASNAENVSIRWRQHEIEQNRAKSGPLDVKLPVLVYNVKHGEDGALRINSHLFPIDLED